MDATGVFNRFTSISNKKGPVDLNEIADAIRVTNTWLSDNSDVVVARTLHKFLPTLCTFLFGSKEVAKNGVYQNVLSSYERKLWAEFLHPKGPLLTKLIRLQNDQTLQYEVTSDYLPPATKRMCELGDLNSIPLFYKSRLKFQSKNSTSGPVTVQSSPQQDMPKTPVVMFNMLEYFMFCFANVVTLVTHDELPVNQSKTSLYHGNRSNFVNQTYQTLDETYFSLLKNYLAFFLPKPSPRKTEMQIPESPMTPARFDLDLRRRGESAYMSATNRTPTVRFSRTEEPPSLEMNDIFSLRDAESVAKAVSVSEFFIGAALDLWLGDNELSRGGSSSVKLWAYAKPNRFVIEAAKMIISHIQSLNLSSLSLESSSSQSRVDIRDREEAQEVAILSAYRLLRPSLYRFLKSGFDNWPREDSIKSIVDLWLLYLCPWKADRTQYSNSWSTAQTFDIYASVRPTSNTAKTQISITKSSISKQYLSLLEQLMQVFGDDQLFSVLKTLESALCSLEQYNHGLEGSTPLSARPRRSHFGSGERSPRLRRESSESYVDRMYSFQNSGPSLKNQLYLFEGKVPYNPVFDVSLASDSQMSFEASMTKVVYVLYGTIERLSYLLDTVDKPVTSPPGSPFPSRSPRPSTTASRSAVTEFSVLGSIKEFFGLVSSSDSASGRGASLTREQIDQMTNNVQRLDKLAALITKVWDLPINASVLSSIQQSHEDTNSLLDEDGERTVEIAPGVKSPDVSSENAKLTSRGKLQVKRGLRKFDTDTVAPIPNGRIEKIIKTYEVKLLVTFFAWTAFHLDALYARFRQSRPSFPQVSFKWLRWFASIPNLILFGTSFFFLFFLLLPFLRWCFSASSNVNQSFSSTPSSSYQSSQAYQYNPYGQQYQYNYNRHPY